MAIGILLGAIGGLLIGACATVAVFQRRGALRDARLAVADRVERELDRTRDQFASLQADAGRLREERATLAQQLRSAEQTVEREQARLEDELARLHDAFASQSQDVMQRVISQLSELSGR
jgi:septal ring factor EnvC (AmiA/AmiB activator)